MDQGMLGDVIDGDTIRFLRVLPHPVERVWRAISDETELRAWMRYPVSFEPRVGGTVRFFGNGDAAIEGRVFVFDAPRALAFSFFSVKPEDAERIEKEWTVRWDLAPAPEGCPLTLTHRRLGGAHLWGLGEGWHGFLSQLAAYLDGTLAELVRAYEARGGESDTSLLTAYRAHASRQLPALADALATDAESAVAEGLSGDAAAAIARLRFVAGQMYEIARQDGPRPDYAPAPPPPEVPVSV